MAYKVIHSMCEYICKIYNQLTEICQTCFKEDNSGSSHSKPPRCQCIDER